MNVAATLRRNRKITITTSATASSSSNCTSRTEARIVDGAVGQQRRRRPRPAATPASCGSSALTRSTTSMTLAPGWRWMLRMIAGVSFAHAARRDVLGVVDDVGDVAAARTGAPLR